MARLAVFQGIISITFRLISEFMGRENPIVMQLEHKDRYRARLPLAIFLLIAFLGCGNTRWKVAETPDLLIYYRPGSYAEKHIEQAKTDYEASFQLAEQFLPRVKKTPKVKVYLYDELKDKGYARVQEREVHYRYGEVFRLTSVHELLHIFLYEINPSAPIRLEEGICRINEGKRKKFKGQVYDIKYYQLVKLTSPDRWKAGEAFADEYKDDDQGNIAAAFALFAIKELGEKRFWAFYEQVREDNWRPLLEQYFGKKEAMIDQDLKAFIQAIPDPPEAFKFKFSPATAHLHQ